MTRRPVAAPAPGKAAPLIATIATAASKRPRINSLRPQKLKPRGFSNPGKDAVSASAKIVAPNAPGDDPADREPADPLLEQGERDLAAIGRPASTIAGGTCSTAPSIRMKS